MSEENETRVRSTAALAASENAGFPQVFSADKLMADYG